MYTRIYSTITASVGEFSAISDGRYNEGNQRAMYTRSTKQLAFYLFIYSWNDNIFFVSTIKLAYVLIFKLRILLL